MQKRWQWIAAGIIVLLMILLALDAYPGLRGGAGWQWTYEPSQSAAAVAILATVLVGYVAGGWLWANRSTGLALTWAFVGAVVITLAVVGVRGAVGYLLFTRTASPVQTGASALAARVFAEEGTQSALQRWTQIMNEAEDANLIHFTTSPPGQPLLHQSTADFFDQPALSGVSQPMSLALRPYQCSDPQVMAYTRGEIVSAGFGMLLPVFAALAVYPLYATARTLGASPLGARSVVLWWPLIPTTALFAPTWNTVYPALCIASFALLARALVSQGRTGFEFKSPHVPTPAELRTAPPRKRRGDFKSRYGILRSSSTNENNEFLTFFRNAISQRRGWVLAFLSGGVLSFATFLNFAVLTVLLLFGMFALGCWFWIARWDTPPRAFGWLLSIGIAFALGLCSVWLVFMLATGVSPLDILQVTFSSHRDLVQRESGAALAWLVLHPYDVALFVGFPVMVLAVIGIWRALRGMMRNQVSPLGVLGLATAITFVAVDLAGVVQGENGRILSFYAPFLMLAGLGAAIGRTAPLSPTLSPTGDTSYRVPRERDQRETTGNRDVFESLPLLIAQAVCIGVMAVFLSVVPLDLNPQPTAPRSDIATFGETPPFVPSGATFTSSDYGGEFRLGQYRYIGDPSAQAITYEFEWEGAAPTERPYQFELVARANNELDGEIVSEPFRWSPQGEGYLTPCWKQGDLVRDTIVLPLPAVSMPVIWQVALRALDERSGDVMVINQAQDETSDTLILEPVRYP